MTILTQFTAHPATAYHPEHPTVYGEFPQVACDMLSRRFGHRDEGLPISFLQGCAGDINSKGLLSGDVARARRHGSLLGRSYLNAMRHLTRSQTDALMLRRKIARVPLANLPSLAELKEQRREIDDFIARGIAGDPDTLNCLGLNFPKALSPRYRAALVEAIRPWNEWATKVQRSGGRIKPSKYLELEVCSLRLGDVAIVGLPCEPFMGIGRQIRHGSPAALTIPCGYANTSSGYVTDAPNTGDREYQSAFYLYTSHPPIRKPAGDVLARVALTELRRMFGKKGLARDKELP